MGKLPHQMSRLPTPRTWERFSLVECSFSSNNLFDHTSNGSRGPGEALQIFLHLPPHPDICSREITNLSCILRLCCAALNTSERVVGHALAVFSLTNGFSIVSVKNSAGCIWITSPSRWIASLYAILASPKIILVSSGRASPSFCLLRSDLLRRLLY